MALGEVSRHHATQASPALESTMRGSRSFDGFVLRSVEVDCCPAPFTTVYRTLKLLAECGLASVVAFEDGVARYEHQYNRRSHHHMVCTECGSSVEFFSPEIDGLEEAIGRRYRYVTTRHTFQIYGVCEACRKRNGSRRLA